MNSDKKTLAPATLGFLLDNPVASQESRPSFPRRIMRWFSRRNKLFLLLVVLPTLLAAAYYGFIASDVYVSQSSFLVENVQDEDQGSSSLGSLLKSSSSGSSDDDSAAVQEFMQSRDALRQLEKEADVRAAFTNSSIDRLSRFGGMGWDNSFEALFYFYTKSHIKKIVTITPSDVSSSISELGEGLFARRGFSDQQ
jgi:capsule polysaccharide export protein KpsE/RkpR